MFKFIYRQRRRLLFGGFFATLYVTTYFSQMLQYLETDVAWISYLSLGLTALIAGVIYMGISAIFITLFRRWRQLAELLPLGMLLNAMLGNLLPDLLGVNAEGFMGSISFFAIWMLMYSLVYGTLLDRFPMYLSWTSSSSFKSQKPAAELWATLVPDEGNIDQHWDKLLHEITADPEDPDSFDMTYTHGHSLYQHQMITFLEHEPLVRAKYYFVGDVDPKNKSLTEGTHAIDITPLPKGGHKVTITEMHTALLPRVGIQLWFDDAVGDSTDHIAATSKGKRDWSVSGLYRRTVLPLT